VLWQTEFGQQLSETDFVQAGVYFGTGSFSIAGLSAVEDDAISYVKTFCSHNYPQSASTANLSALMSHSAIAIQIAQFASEIQAAESHGKIHVFGETNSGRSGSAHHFDVLIVDKHPLTLS
jgi:hypothetical protein